MIELDDIQNETNRHLGKLNSLKMRYMEWFSRKHQSFLDSIKLIHILGDTLLPKEVNTMKNYRRVSGYCRKMPRNGTPRDQTPGRMDEFLFFWEEFLILKKDNDKIYKKVCDFCNSITRLREPLLKDEIDRLHYKLLLFCSEDFDFTSINNERSNLFTYRVSLQDHKYHGLMSYMPFLMGFAGKICYWISKLHIEAL
ncbi:hypothetical protein FSP39_015625 [Pinctada imbricata]|uniref:Uncharacterized protein n=1 Tax=Pinctada imbricata TaxID=66713 RepID=A0AA88YMX0_PINIB|nr:hypothetical protein FSP39_015625 [Pinctada imbricata]